MLKPKSSLLILVVQKSCKTSYESTQTGNESTQTQFFPGLSRPVRTRDEMNNRETGNESMQGTGEPTQSGIPKIESTCSDPRELGPKKKGEWVILKSEWVDSLKFPRIDSISGSTCSDPGVLRRVMSRLIELKHPNMRFCNALHLFAPFLYVMNTLGIKNEWNWPIEWKWNDLTPDHDHKIKPEIYNWHMKVGNVTLWTE